MLTLGPLTLTMDNSKIHTIHNKCYIGITGLGSDAITFSKTLLMRTKLYELKEGRPIPPTTFGNMVSSLLYQKRFGPYFIEPVVAGLDDENKPFIYSTDVIGAPSLAQDFAIAGTCTEELFGMAESLWRPDLEPDMLFEVISQTLLSSFDRNALSGWGGEVYIVYVVLFNL